MKIIENPDKEEVARIRAQIKKNHGHCCCAIVFDKDNLCMCKAFREQIKRGESGYCDCGLYQCISDPKEK